MILFDFIENKEMKEGFYHDQSYRDMHAAVARASRCHALFASGAKGEGGGIAPLKIVYKNQLIDIKKWLTTAERVNHYGNHDDLPQEHSYVPNCKPYKHQGTM